ncbi:MAG TPA: amphi-Trp domain-containing protein [Acidimicrobiia bacterium]|jgi:amphi-Trp domain-containing protein|nr:amphi-Trp domain-containing protein [Acidimicrobiia bacterium]
MSLIEHSVEAKLRREEAAERLRALADELSRQNKVTFVRDGKKFTVDVPDEVEFSLEIEVGGDENEIEVELKW